MQVFFSMLLLTVSISSPLAEEWVSRHGNCYEWEGRWDVQQEASGVWVGVIDFVHVGGHCVAGTKQYLTHEVRAVIVGGDFFARRTTGAVACYLHGYVRAGEVRGWEQCSGIAAPMAAAVRLSPPPAEDQKPPKH